MNVLVAIVLGVTAYCLFDRWCLHREKMKSADETKEH